MPVQGNELTVFQMSLRFELPESDLWRLINNADLTPLNNTETYIKRKYIFDSNLVASLVEEEAAKKLRVLEDPNLMTTHQIAEEEGLAYATVNVRLRQMELKPEFSFGRQGYYRLDLYREKWENAEQNRYIPEDDNSFLDINGCAERLAKNLPDSADSFANTIFVRQLLAMTHIKHVGTYGKNKLAYMIEDIDWLIERLRVACTPNPDEGEDSHKKEAVPPNQEDSPKDSAQESN